MSRKSHYGWFPHFFYVRPRRDSTPQIVGFVPRNPKIKFLPPPFFKGKVKWGETQWIE